MHLLKQILNDAGRVEIPSAGCSMYPFIKEGNICGFRKFEWCELKKGDVVLFISSNGDLVGHRFVCSVLREGQCLLIFKGDTNLASDEPVTCENVIAKLQYVKKRYWVINAEGRISRLWAEIISSSKFITSTLHRFLRLINLLQGRRSKHVSSRHSKEFS